MEVRIQSNALIHANYWREFVPHIEWSSFKHKPGEKNVAARLLFLVEAFPTMPAGLALAWAKGEAAVKLDGDVLLVSYDEKTEG